MVDIKTYKLAPTALMPNSPLPLIHYIGLLQKENERTSGYVYDLFQDNGWQVQWVFRYGHTQRAHYHSASHECMAVLTGTATIRFGVADTDPDMEKNTHGSAKEEGGIELKANPGDLFIIPAGVSHKTYNCSPNMEFKRLSPGDGHSSDDGALRNAYHAIELSGFAMLGAYPKGCQWDFMEGGESEGNYEAIWNIPKPESDPVFGHDQKGLLGIWSVDSSFHERHTL